MHSLVDFVDDLFGASAVESVAVLAADLLKDLFVHLSTFYLERGDGDDVVVDADLSTMHLLTMDQ